MKPLRILLTGGPGGGKSSALSQLRSMLMKRSFNVFVIEENATRVIEAAGGYDQNWRKRENLLELQRAFLFFQRAQEDVFARVAGIKEGRTIILHDRGILDGKVFVDDALWPEIIAGENMKESEIISRYDLILHMTSVAVDRPELYEFGPGSNNPSRFHDVNEAREQDGRCASVYSAHPRVVHVRTSETFEEKIAHVLHAIEELCNEFFSSEIFGISDSSLLPKGRTKLSLTQSQTWHSVINSLKASDFKQLVSLIVPVSQGRGVIATMQLSQDSVYKLDDKISCDLFLRLRQSEKCFYEHRSTARKMLSAREFLLELEALQASHKVPSGSVIKRQLCWTDAESGQYFALTQYSDAVDDSSLADTLNYWTLDKPGSALVPACLVTEDKRVLKVQSTVDACDLAEINAAKRRKTHE